MSLERQLEQLVTTNRSSRNLMRSPGGPRVRMVAGHLSEMAQRLGPGAKLPTMDELCRLLDTSIGTMTQAFNDLEQRNVIIRKQGSGVYVSPYVNRKSITVLVDSSVFGIQGASPFWGQVWELCVERAQQRMETNDEIYSFRLVTANDYKVVTLPEAIRHEQDRSNHFGVISLGLWVPDLTWDDTKDLPLVTFGGTGYWTVAVETTNWIPRAAQYFAQKNCRSVAALFSVDLGRPDAGTIEGTATYDRRVIWEEALRNVGIPFDVTLIHDALSMARHGTTNLPISYQEQGYWAGQKLLNRPASSWPHGIYSSNDMLTSGLLLAFEERDIKVGRDIQVASHSNMGSPILYGMDERMLLFRVDPREVTDSLFSLLEKVMSGTPPEEHLRWISDRGWNDWKKDQL